MSKHDWLDVIIMVNVVFSLINIYFGTKAIILSNRLKGELTRMATYREKIMEGSLADREWNFQKQVAESTVRKTYN